MPHTVIIGNGVAGITAARHLRKRCNDRITVVSAEAPFFFSRPALMYAFMGHMERRQLEPYERWFWTKNRIELRQAFVECIDTTNRHCLLDSGDVLTYDTAIIATGSVANRFGWPGQDLSGVQSFTTMQDLDLLEQNARGVQSAVIVGGGLIGVEVAEMLASRGIAVTMLVREASYWNNVLPAEESALVTHHIRAHGIDVRLCTQLHSIEGGTDGRVAAVVTDSGDRLPCGLVVLTAGVRPNIALAERSGIAVRNGVVVDDYFATSAPDVYAIGDCAEFSDGRVDLLWYTARAHGEHLAAVLTGDRRPFQRGVFYNSAKFFDVEYMTYGDVPANVSNEESWLWQQGDKLLRIVHRNGIVQGFNAMGIRLRGDACTKWIEQGASLQHVVQQLSQAEFDQEFTQTMRRIQREAAL
jgi:NAD(P)H-nitrite reductase large subunit